MTQRARILLASADGAPVSQISAELGFSRTKVQRWLDRYETEGLSGVEHDRPRTGRPRRITPEVEEEILRITLEAESPQGTHWSSRALAAMAGLHFTQVARIWRSHGIEPARRFDPARDMPLVARVRDIVGVYVSPPERVMVFTCDKSGAVPCEPLQHAALAEGKTIAERRPASPGTLFTALVATISGTAREGVPTHRDEEFLRFLRQVERETEPDLEVHVVLHRYSAHGHPKVHSWLGCHPRVRFHFQSTAFSWLKLVESFLRQLADQPATPRFANRLSELKEAIQSRLGARDCEPLPFVWSPNLARCVIQPQ